MPRFAANLSMMYNELPFLDRFEAAAQDGFRAVEYLFPYAYAAQDIKARLEHHDLQQVLFNAPPGDWEAGERGMACLPGREAELRGDRWGVGMMDTLLAQMTLWRGDVAEGLRLAERARAQFKRIDDCKIAYRQMDQHRASR